MNFKQGSIFKVSERDQYEKTCKCGRRVDLVNVPCQCGKIHSVTHRLLGERYLVVINSEKVRTGSMKLVVPTQQLTPERFDDWSLCKDDPIRNALPMGRITGLPSLSIAMLNQLHSFDKDILDRSTYVGVLPNGCVKEILNKITLILGLTPN